MKDISFKRVLIIAGWASLAQIVLTIVFAIVGIAGGTQSVLMVPLTAVILALKNKDVLDSRRVFILTNAFAGVIFGAVVGVIAAFIEGRPETALFMFVFLGIALGISSGLLAWVTYYFVLMRQHPLAEENLDYEASADDADTRETSETLSGE